MSPKWEEKNGVMRAVATFAERKAADNAELQGLTDKLCAALQGATRASNECCPTWRQRNREANALLYQYLRHWHIGRDCDGNPSDKGGNAWLSYAMSELEEDGETS